MHYPLPRQYRSKQNQPFLLLLMQISIQSSLAQEEDRLTGRSPETDVNEAENPTNLGSVLHALN